jgi:ferredoxin-NADP reductase
LKAYPSRNRLTNELQSAKTGDEIIVQEPFGSIQYKGDGIFIAGGAGITPFIPILRQLKEAGNLNDNKLLFANKTREDIILEAYFDTLLGDNFVNVLSGETVDGYKNGYITEDIIKEMSDANNKYYYLCGPEPMMAAVEEQLAHLGIAKEYICKRRVLVK